MSNTKGTDYGIDAPVALRNLFIIGAVLLLIAFFGPHTVPLGKGNTLEIHFMCLYTGVVLVAQSVLMYRYSRFGKFGHRDAILDLCAWRGDEQVLDVGCGRGLLLAGAAKRLTTGHATGIDIWSNVDMGGNNEAATQHNLQLEGVAGRCTLVSAPAQSMPFQMNTFDVILSNLCIHNISSAHDRLKAIERIAYVLKPGGTAILSDFKHTRTYAKQLRGCGLTVSRRHGNIFTTFPPLGVVIAHKPV